MRFKRIWMQISTRNVYVIWLTQYNFIGEGNSVKESRGQSY